MVNSKCRMTWEVIRILSILTGIYLLLGQLLYGVGSRINAVTDESAWTC